MSERLLRSLARGWRWWAILAVCLSPALTAAQPNRLTLEQISGAPYPYDMVAAPRGTAVAWIYNERGARNVWIAEETSAGHYKSHRLTAYTGDDGIDINDLRWTGDGQWLVYTRGGDSGGKVAVNPTSDVAGPKAGAIWVVAVGGGDPKRLGDGVSAAPAPRGDAVVFVHNGQPFLTSAGQGGTPAPLFVDRGQVGSLRWSPDGNRLAFVSTRPHHSMVGVYDFANRKVTWMSPSIDKDAFPAWSPDSQHLVFVRSPSGEEQPQGLNREAATPWELWIAAAADGSGKRIWAASRGRGSVFRFLFNSADSLFWGAGDHIVFPWEVTGWVRLYSLVPGSQPVLLTPGDAEIFAGVMSSDRARIAYATNLNDIDRRHVWEVPVKGAAPRQLTTGKGIEDYPVLTPNGDLFVLHGESRMPLRPMSALKGSLQDLAPQALPEHFPSAQLVEPELITFPAGDGLTVHGQLFVPNGLEPGTRAPALVFTHGGPTNRQAFAAWDSFETHSHLYEANQFLAAGGYVVLSINYRGGSGYGLDWREAKGFGTTGGSELNDVIGAARYLQGRADVDPKRLGIWGGSYGGRMTALAMARAPEFWVAGVDYAGVHDLSAYYASRLADPAARKLAYESSAMAYIDGWRAPVKLMVNDADALEPQTVMLAAALRARGIPVEQMMLPDEVHFMLKHSSWSTVFQATRDYLDGFLKP